MVTDTSAHPTFSAVRLWSRFRPRLSFPKLGLGAKVIAFLALLPVAYMLSTAITASRDVVYWDELETALALVLKLNDGTTPGEFLGELFALNNEHRMVTSRLLYAVSYWLTGTVNFSVISAIGNASLVALCVVLLVTATTATRRLRLAVLLSALLFQKEHYENFLWSGSSIDHFQVVLLACLAIVGVARQTTSGLLVGALFATLATFTLAHGILVWPVGAAMLLRSGGWRQLMLWSACGVAVIGSFLMGFEVNQSHHFAQLSLRGIVEITSYWLSMLGAVPALGNTFLAPMLGGALLVGLFTLARRGALRRESIAFPLAVWAIAAAALIAAGRAVEAKGLIHSRYYVLSGVAWALVLFMAAERFSHPRRPLRLLVAGLPFLAGFNLVANEVFAAKAESWQECRDRAALRFKQHGVDGKGTFALHPSPARATALLKRAEELGVYRMGPVCLSEPFVASATVSKRLAYFVDEMTVNERSAYISGWAALPGEISRRGETYIMLRSKDRTYMYEAVTVTRPDVAKATGNPEWELAGFSFARRRDRLPTGEFQLGFLISNEGKEEYIMTAHRLRLEGAGEALLAKGN
ncbi:MAG: hypothetical protein JNK23_19135 [Opitutaceae bacterium]|nr:hypothetical protein [Opitutaceae bacterium]